MSATLPLREISIQPSQTFVLVVKMPLNKPALTISATASTSISDLVKIVHASNPQLTADKYELKFRRIEKRKFGNLEEVPDQIDNLKRCPQISPRSTQAGLEVTYEEVMSIPLDSSKRVIDFADDKTGTTILSLCSKILLKKAKKDYD
jgi:hypothetical protein